MEDFTSSSCAVQLRMQQGKCRLDYSCENKIKNAVLLKPDLLPNDRNCAVHTALRARPVCRSIGKTSATTLVSVESLHIKTCLSV